MHMKSSCQRMLGVVVGVLALASLSFGQVTKEQQDELLGIESHIGKLTGHAKDGAPLYHRYCNGCHGPLGDGAGENAQYMDPRPRNFTSATFRCLDTISCQINPSDGCTILPMEIVCARKQTSLS